METFAFHIDDAAMRKAIAEFCRIRRASAKKKLAMYPRPAHEVFVFVAAAIKLRSAGSLEFSKLQRMELIAKIYPVYLEIWTEIGGSPTPRRGTGAKRRKKYQLMWPNRRPEKKSEQMSERDSRLRTLRRLITTREKELMGFRTSGDRISADAKARDPRRLRFELAGLVRCATGATPKTEAHKLRVQLPRQNYGDDT